MAKKVSVNHQLLARLLTEPSGKDKYFWGREMKIASQLLKKYGQEFLLTISPPSGYKIQSLIFFLTGDGKNYLSDQMLEYKSKKMDLFSEKEQAPLLENKIGEDLKIEIRKPRTLKEFIKYG